MVRLRSPLRADLPLGIQHFSRLRLLLAAPSDNRWRQRESFNAVEDRPVDDSTTERVRMYEWKKLTGENAALERKLRAEIDVKSVLAGLMPQTSAVVRKMLETSPDTGYRGGATLRWEAI